jgi:hypothetical protein
MLLNYKTLDRFPFSIVSQLYCALIHAQQTNQRKHTIQFKAQLLLLFSVLITFKNNI